MKKSKEPVLVPTARGRFLVENQTRYNTDDLMRIINWVEARAAKTSEANSEWCKETYYTKAGRMPLGATLQIVDQMAGVISSQESVFDETVGHFVQRKIELYASPGEYWNAVRICPPDKLYKNPLEAMVFGGDVKTAPEDLAKHFATTLAAVQYNISLYEPTVSGRGGVEVRWPDLTVRIGDERGSPRRGTNKRPKELSHVFEMLTSARDGTYEASNGLRRTVYSLRRADGHKVELGLDDMGALNAVLDAAREAIDKAQQEIQTYISNIPAE
jgi:hypothetical protein